MITYRHKVFVSYHHANDQAYRDQFEHIFEAVHSILLSKCVQIGDIDPYSNADRIRQIIRDSTVTVVLIGKDTWKRKHLDWEIAASIRKTKYNIRSGLLGIFLPSHLDYGRSQYNPHLIPPRLYDNVAYKYAKLYD